MNRNEIILFVERLSDLWRLFYRRVNPFAKDFYLARVGLAAYFEKDWSDVFISPEKINFNFASFDPKHLSLGDSLSVSRSVLSLLETKSLKPASYLEIGPGLGRAFYEIVRGTPSLKKAQLVEPSKLLFTGLENLFVKESPCVFPLVFGNEFLSEIEIDPSRLASNLKHLDLEILDQPFSLVKNNLAASDLVMCLNVLDQCKNSSALLELIKEKTNVGGLLVVSCTFLWQKKHPWSKKAPFKNLRTQFGKDWEVLAEENLPFSIRVNERYWYTFLSQVLYLKRR